MGEMAEYCIEQAELQDLWDEEDREVFYGSDPWEGSQSNGLVTKIGHRSVYKKKDENK